MNKPKAFIVALVIVGFIFLAGNVRKENLLRGLTSQEDIDLLIDEASRPVMHTFFSPILPNLNAQDPMLEEWKEQWSKVGFSTKVLTLKDAAKHPYYHQMSREIEKVFPNDIYNQFCFYRYLAMASSGGGWMSDYDTFPTNFPLKEGKDLPNGGMFTSYQAHVPALIAASSEEWERVGKLLVEAIPRIKDDVKSDMYALLTLREEQLEEKEDHGIEFLVPSWNVKMWFMYLEPEKVDCRDMGIGRAIHFSHAAMARAYNAKSSVFPVEAPWPLGSQHRAAAARAFMEQWQQQCGGSNVETEEELSAALQ
mmetsp:Transcript_18702/g.27306  ORF Transcript_18702/g.27306 Transcript_18702/m.27306 type:complete len:309 (-) Transcript_18702:1064-1990(-)|eukprot:CAMPEP_0197259160 /NCGR_PEP_ID=MMETSP1429-20130617/83374_1 /TAXON_ID=49237 /ORGANISM="Chaetoceros  sp., Strain UNC1202" /LENGTH=308 /DNA_ID=CAMNT_0042723361 /DNA_START=39 /DNA_END=965 /DNA_ORIENTATION=+